MSDLERRLRARFREMMPEYEDEQIAITGYRDPATGALNPDPLVGLAGTGQIWVHAENGRSSVPALIEEPMRAYTRAAGVRCVTGISRTGARVAVKPVADAINAPITAQYHDANVLSKPVPAANITDGICLPPDGGGLFIHVGALERLGWAGGPIGVDGGDVPTNPNEQRWLIVYHGGVYGDAPTYATASAHTTAGNQGLLVSEAAAVVLPAGSFRLFAVSLGYGTTDILASNTRRVDLRDWLTPRYVVAADTSAASAGDVPTWNSTSEQWEAAAQTGGGGGTASLLLDYTASTDLFNGATITANTWTDVNTNQSFTVTNGSAIIEFNVICNLLLGSVSSSSIALRLVIDSAGTPVYRQLVGVRSPAGDYGAAPGGVVAVTGLSAAAHTAKVQVQITSTGTAYLRANTVPDFENLRIQVKQL